MESAKKDAFHFKSNRVIKMIIYSSVQGDAIIFKDELFNFITYTVMFCCKILNTVQGTIIIQELFKNFCYWLKLGIITDKCFKMTQNNDHTNNIIANMLIVTLINKSKQN